VDVQIHVLLELAIIGGERSASRPGTSCTTWGVEKSCPLGAQTPTLWLLSLYTIAVMTTLVIGKLWFENRKLFLTQHS
jgi:hypothetical protein